MNQPSILIAVFLSPLLLTVAVSPAHAVSKPLEISAATVLGYDNNVNLDPGREGDAFAQETVSVEYHRLLGKKINLRASYDLSNSNYFGVTDQNALVQSAGGGADFWLNAKTILETDYSFTYVWFPYNRSVTFDQHNVRAGVRYKLFKNMNLKAGLGHSTQEFDDRKLRQANGLLSLDDERKDGRLTADAEVAVRLFDKSLFRFGYAHGWNDSNDQFHDYYDYSTDRLSISTAVKIIPKVSSFIKLAYENRRYDSRPLLNDDSRLQRDHVYTLTIASFYRLRQNLSLGAIYSYRQKLSNEPTQRYSGSVSTLGLYYSF